MKQLISIALSVGLLVGCASVRQEATTTTTGTNGVTTTMTVKSSVVASGDSKAVVDKLRASAGKTLSLGASGVSEESSLSTTLSALAEVLAQTYQAGRASVTK